MRFAIVEAIKALENGDVPIGAVVVRENNVIGKGFNQVETLNDSTAHAEMIAITAASNTINDWRLTDSYIFVTKEPCPMCAGAILNSRIKGIVHGVDDKKWGSCGSYYDICRDNRDSRFPIVIGKILEKDCRDIINEFFKNIRKSNLWPASFLYLKELFIF